MNGVRQGWLVAVREMRERSRSRAFRASLVVMILVVVGVIIAARRCSSTGGGTKDVGLTGSIPNELPRAIQDQSDAVGITARVHRYDSLAAGEEAVRDGDVDVLVVDAQRLEWRRQADEQLQAVVTGAIQLVAVRDRAAAAGISPDTLLALVAPVPVENVELGSVAGRSPDDETAAVRHDRPAVHRHHHLREPGADRRRGGEGQPRRRGAARPHARPATSSPARSPASACSGSRRSP